MIHIALLAFIAVILWQSGSDQLTAFFTAFPMFVFAIYRIVKLEESIEELKTRIDKNAHSEDNTDLS